jgi:hypothetical protein
MRFPLSRTTGQVAGKTGWSVVLFLTVDKVSAKHNLYVLHLI